jgi:hypothetical protein
MTAMTGMRKRGMGWPRINHFGSSSIAGLGVDVVRSVQRHHQGALAQ